MNPVMRKKKLFGTEEIHKINRIKSMIKCNIWCPSPRKQHGIKQCELCGQDIDLDKFEPNFYAVWCGLICERCNRVYKREIEELSKL